MFNVGDGPSSTISAMAALDAAVTADVAELKEVKTGCGRVCFSSFLPLPLAGEPRRIVASNKCASALSRFSYNPG